MSFIIRQGTKKDAQAILNLIKELAVFEKLPNEVEITTNDLIKDGFSSNPKFKTFLAQETDGTLIGMALFYERYSTWKGTAIHLEDLIVTEEKRNIGAGKALYTSVLKFAHDNNLFKFGGASVKDVDAVKNVARVLKHEGTEKTLVVISAMGKMTNKFEEIIDAYIYKKDSLTEELDFAKNFHKELIEGLFSNTETVTAKVAVLFGQLSEFMTRNTKTDFSYVYDQIIGYGELLSTTIKYLVRCS